MTATGPTPLVLVHGGGHGAWCWRPLLAHLDAPALAVDLPPRSIRGGADRSRDVPELRTLTLDDFADSVLADVDAAGYERFVLVGHSMGGLTISELARREPGRVDHLVYVSCIVPPEGVSAMDALPQALVDAAPDAVEMFCNDMDEEQTRFVLENMGNEAGGVLHEPVRRSGISIEVPKTFVKLLRDQSLRPEDQDVYIENLRRSPGGDVDVITIDAGHDVMISRPKELADVLNRIAAAVV
jgi:pimeloyl-ACP methyl ester carboxylesterase